MGWLVGQTMKPIHLEFTMKDETKTPHLSELWDVNETKSCACTLCFLYAICFGFLGGPRVLTGYRTFTRGSGVMRCDGMLILLSLDLL